MHFLEAEPEVGVDRSKPGFVVGPGPVPVECVVEMLVYDDPAEYRHDRYVARLGRYCHFNTAILCNETYKKDRRGFS